MYKRQKSTRRIASGMLRKLDVVQKTTVDAGCVKELRFVLNPPIDGLNSQMIKRMLTLEWLIFSSQC